jgi:HD-GYP domain-containing protein (c-di-GMP phosphodiesterase class II)
MQLIPTQALEPGTMLAADLFTHAGVPLLRSGATMTDRIRERLIREGIDRVWVIGGDADSGTDALSVETRQKATRAVVKTFTASGEALANSGRLTTVALDSLSSVVEAIGQDVASAPAAAIALSDLQATDDFTHRHSVNVCIFGLLVAEAHYKRHGWVDFEGNIHRSDFEPRLRQLGLGLLLHDIGKVSVPDATLNKPGKLDAEEWELMKTHALVGARLLPTEAMPAQIIAVVRDHHERLDGSGYPTGKTGEHIHEFARIAAIADTFDAITATRPYAPGRPTADAVRIIMECADRGQLDTSLVDSFCRVIAPYPIGTEISLEDGRKAIVIEVDMDDPWHPTVQVYSAEGTSSTERYAPFISDVGPVDDVPAGPSQPARAGFPSASIT